MQKVNGSNTAEISPHADKAGLAKLYIGKDAFELISQQVFQEQWDNLHQVCPWATVFQSRQFVHTWYKNYEKEYLPIVVITEQEGKLTGLLTMALHSYGLKDTDLRYVSRRIVGAGQYDAEYQTWIAEEAYGESFIKEALLQIRESFPGCDIIFRFLPPQTPLDWARTDPHWQDRLVVQSYKRPLMVMNDPGLAKLFRKSEFKNKLNRLKRLGEVKFEHVTAKSRFSAILPDITTQYDFRQGAMFNKNQFRDCPLKADFLLAMFEQNLLHVSVLKVNEEIVAAIVAVAGRNWVHLGGINIHAPFNAKYYSPGFVHFLMLGQQLAQDGVSVFDLTPGGDSYKERMATAHDQVYEMVFASSTSSRTKRHLRKLIHMRLIKSGIRPMSFELTLRKKIYLLKYRVKGIRNQGLLLSMLDNVTSLYKGRRNKMHKIEVQASKPSASIPIKQNNLNDLLDYDDKGGRQSRWRFLEAAMQRLENGDRSYTWSEGGRLLVCAWLSNPPKAAAAGEVRPQERAAVLYGLYVHPAGRDKLKEFVGAAAAQVVREVGQVPLYALASAGDALLLQTMTALEATQLQKNHILHDNFIND